MFSKEFRIFAIIVVLAAFFAIAASASPDLGPTPGALGPTISSPQPTPPPPPPTIPPIPLPTLPPRAPSPVPTAAPTLNSLLNLGARATIVFPTSELAVSFSVNGLFQLVALPQDQLAQVTIQFPTTEVAQVVKVEALDGGLLAAVIPATEIGGNNANIIIPAKRVDSGAVSAHGNFTFAFRVGHSPGLYQIRIKEANHVFGLQFWVNDPQHPANNPPALKPALATQSPPIAPPHI